MLISFFSLPDWEDVFIVFKQICLSIDTVIYNAIAWMYSVFMALAGARIFSNDLVDSFVQRMYLIVSIVMLFVVAYSFLNVIINPDNLTKGNSSPTKIVTNIVKALVVIVLVPSAFSFAFSFQKAIVKENIIGKLILGTKKKVNVDDFDTRSADFSVTLFESNFYQVDTDELTTKAYQAASEDARINNDIGEFSKFLTKNDHKKVQYNFIITGIVGIYVLYTLLIFSIDLGLRVVKLFFYEIIAPVPALLMIVPSQDKAFKSWLKITLKCFADLFIKIAIISFGVYIINMLSEAFITGGTIVGFESSNQNVVFFARVFIILGVVMFMRKAPKYIEDLFGWKLDEKGLSLKKRLDEAGVTALFGAGAGMVAGSYASVKGAHARDSKRLVGAGLSGAFHGARLGGKAGWYGSLNGIGAAHSYALANQQAWAHISEEGGAFKGLRVAGEMLRDNVGMKSYYDSLIAYKEIEFNKENAAYNRSIQSLDAGAKNKKKELEDKHKYDVRTKANDTAITAGKELDDLAESEIMKEKYLTGTYATVLERDSTGALVENRKQITASNISSLIDMYDDAAEKGLITRERHAQLKAELDTAKERIKSNYISNNMLMHARDEGRITSSSDTATKNSFYTKFEADYVRMAESSAEYKRLDADYNQIVATSGAGSAAALAALAKRDQIVNDAKTSATKQFNDILTNTSDNKTNLNVVNKVEKFNDILGYTGASAVGVDETGVKVSADIKTSDYGSDLLKAIKAIKIANSQIEYDKNKDYRDPGNAFTYIDEKGTSQLIQLGQYDTERNRISELSKAKTEELKDFKVAHADEEQISKMAQERRKFNTQFKGGKKG